MVNHFKRGHEQDSVKSEQYGLNETTSTSCCGDQNEKRDKKKKFVFWFVEDETKISNFLGFGRN